MEITRHETLVVGSGVAGLSTALALVAEGSGPRVRVTVLSNAPLGFGGSSHMAQGGVAVAVGADDTAEDHAADTLAVSAGLGVRSVVETLTDGGPAALARLLEFGAQFDGVDDAGSQPSLGREAGHGKRRIVHANGDATGAEIMRALRLAVLSNPRIRVIDDVEVLDLVTAESGAVAGVVCTPFGAADPVLHLAGAVVLATGGYGHCFSRTTTPDQVMGAGIAMASRAGAQIADMEFVQFHPTALAIGSDPMPLLTEALRGEGAVLVNETGERFMTSIHPDAELAPRDVVARANYRQIQLGHTPYLDARDAVGDAFPDRFPTVFGLAMSHGLDPRVDLLPVSPAAHYCMGGIAVDVDGRTSLPGLWAVGEVTSSGVHGANRLASNSLLEGLVMGPRVADDIRSGLRLGGGVGVAVPIAALTSRDSDIADDSVVAAVRELLWAKAGVERDATGLNDGLVQLGTLQEAGPVSRNVVTIARLVLEAALDRLESRGAHYRGDMPESDPAQAHRTLRASAPVARAFVAVEGPRDAPTSVRELSEVGS